MYKVFSKQCNLFDSCVVNIIPTNEQIEADIARTKALVEYTLLWKTIISRLF